MTTWSCTASHISPDLDTVTYTLAGMDNRETGWGVAGETWAVMDELARLGGEDWFRLGDRDLATHLFRTGRLRAGDALSAVTADAGTRRGVAVRLLPVTDDPLRTRVTLAEPSPLGPAGTEVGFQDYFVRLRHDVAVRGVRFEGADGGPAGARRHGGARAGGHDRGLPVEPGRLHRAPAGRSRACATRWSPAGTRWWPCRPSSPAPPSRDPADRLMAELGTEPSVVGVARLYAPWVGTLVVDVADAGPRRATSRPKGVRCVVTPTRS